jgi:hypothetical protein
MYLPLDVFDSPVMTPEAFAEWVEIFSEASGYFYRTMGSDGKDLFPKCPLAVDRAKHPMVYIIGLVTAYRPGKVILQGVARVKGFKPDVIRAYENLDVVPAVTDVRERRHILDLLRKRLDNSILILAENAGLEDVPRESVRHSHVSTVPNS